MPNQDAVNPLAALADSVELIEIHLRGLAVVCARALQLAALSAHPDVRREWHEVLWEDEAFAVCRECWAHVGPAREAEEDEPGE